MCRVAHTLALLASSISQTTHDPPQMSDACPRRSQLASPVKNRIVGAMIGGQNTMQVSRTFGVPRRTVRRIFARFETTGTTKNKPRSGRPRLLDDHACRLLRRTARKNRFAPYKILAKQLHTKISPRTVKRELEAMDLKRRKARRAPYITKANRVQRLARAKQLAKITMKELKSVIFSDECYVYLGSHPGAVYCTRSPDEVWHEDCIIPTFTKSPVRVMVWGCIMYNRKGPLIVLDYPGGKGGGMTAKRYIEQVLDGCLLDFYKQVRRRNRSVTFQQDNARCHTAKSTQQWFEQYSISRFPHPPSSPDISAIEPCWLDLKRNIWARRHPPTSLGELEAAVLEAWEQIPIEKINNYILSIPRRAQAVIDSKGGPTRY